MGRLSLPTWTLLTKLVNENRTYWDEHLLQFYFIVNCIQSSNMVYTISISIWITSINANKVHCLVVGANDKDNILVKLHIEL
jgi:hypothetical protein